MQAQQRFSDSWCSAIGSSALTIVNGVFDADEGFNTNEAQQEFAADIIESLGFVYENIDSNVSYKLICTSRSTFLQNIIFSPSKAPSLVR